MAVVVVTAVVVVVVVVFAAAWPQPETPDLRALRTAPPGSSA